MTDYYFPFTIIDMADKVCRRCEKLLKNGDLLRATIITRFVSLKSKLHYALERPTACPWIEHFSCFDPQGEYSEENVNEGG